MEVIRTLQEEDLVRPEGVTIKQSKTVTIGGRESAQETNLLILTGCSEDSPASQIVCEKIREVADTHSGDQMVVVAPLWNATYLRKRLELAFRGGPKSCLLHTSGKDAMEEKRTIQVAMGDQSYSEVVKKLKAMGEKFDGLRVDRLSQRGNNIRVALKGTQAITKSLSEKISAETKLTATDFPNRVKGVVVRGMDEETTLEEVKDRVATVAECSRDDIRATEIRGRERGSHSLVFLPEKAAERLVGVGRVRFGWSSWSFKMKVDPDFCVKCQLFGHETRTCDKPHLEGLRCMRCSQMGHLRRDCQSGAHCGSCNIDGHQMNSMACSKYRYLVEEKTQRNHFLV